MRNLFLILALVAPLFIALSGCDGKTAKEPEEKESSIVIDEVDTAYIKKASLIVIDEVDTAYVESSKFIMAKSSDCVQVEKSHKIVIDEVDTARVVYARLIVIDEVDTAMYDMKLDPQFDVEAFVGRMNAIRK